MPNPVPKELKSGVKASRDFSIVRSGIDEAARTVELAFSSEQPYERYWGIEVLDHKKSSLRLDRLERSGALLMDHDTRDQVGVIEQVRIGSDRVGRAVVRFGRSVRANEIFQDVVDGIRSNVSVGYLIHAAVLASEKDGVGTYRVTDWEPFEISLVSVPADITVGVGRDADTDQTPPPITKAKAMPEPIETRAADPGNTTAVADAQRNGADTERKRTSDILGIAAQYKKYGLDEIANAHVQSGASVDEFRHAAMKHMASAPKATAEIGMTNNEVKQYSLVRAINALANPGDKRARDAAAFELECSAAAADRAGKASQGLMVPFDIMSAKRDLLVGTNTAGGYTVATELLGGSFIDMLRNAMVVSRMGTRILSGLVGNIAIPRMTGGGTAYWVAENVAVTESGQTFDQVTMAPKTVGTFTDISRKLLLQSSIDVESLVQQDLATCLGLAIQSAAIKGGGAGEPTGIISTVGIGSVAGGTNGLAPTWAHIVGLETAVAVANADVGSLGYLTNTKVRGKLKLTEQFATTNGMPVWANGTTPLNGYQAGVTNAVPSNLTKGSASGICSAIVFGNFADLLIGMWGGLDLLVDPYTGGAAGTVRLRVLQDVDVAVRHPESFAAMLDALTT